jgi:hypothetical protein
MAKSRLELQLLLEILLGRESVYFQEPNNVRMAQLGYPAIVYAIDNEETKYADNRWYTRDTRYTVTIIDRNPDSDIPKKIADLPLCSFNRFFVAENLNHFVYSLYF